MVKLIAAADNDQASNIDIRDNNALKQSEHSGLITVYLAYAEEAKLQHYLTIQVSQGATLYEALAQAGWLSQFDELATWCEQVADMTTPTAKRWHVGVYAQKQPLNYQLQPFDRIEVYRSLSADPMSQRKSKSRG
ncbi:MULTISPECIES: RnfH family protein [unclassified Psychrobacter]|uniref:RnfH family protein n=1 Tax=unclassified Psychrobacter TaxID=196806 RepID=UPI0025CCB936|nr:MULTISPECIES: RnfH family protein [unclassified Psychrobacter]